MTVPPPEPGSLPASYFDDLWSAVGDTPRDGPVDPWGLEAGWYEDRKRACILAALPALRFQRAFEPGCANGAFSELLAPRCDELLCWEAAHRPAATARARLAGRSHVRVAQAAVPGEWPEATFDLIVVAELAYYLDTTDRAALWTAAADSLEPGGTLLAVHWVRSAPDYPADGNTVHDELVAHARLQRIASHTEADFRLEVFTRVPPAALSVAERTGLR